MLVVFLGKPQVARCTAFKFQPLLLNLPCSGTSATSGCCSGGGCCAAGGGGGLSGWCSIVIK